MNRFQKLLIALLLFSPATQINSSAAEIIDRPNASPSVIADRISLSMRGIPATPAEQKIIAESSDGVEQLLATYLKDRRFEEVMTRFWLSRLQINGRADLDATLLSDRANASILNQLSSRSPNHPRAHALLVLNRPSGASCQARLEIIPNFPLPPTKVEYDKAVADCANTTLSETQRNDACSRKVLFDERRRTFDAHKKVHVCACGTEINIRPYWNPGTIHKACPSVVRAISINDINKSPAPAPTETCGANLVKCAPADRSLFAVSFSQEHLGYFPQALPGGSYTSELIQGITEEPGRLIAKIISERADFRTVLTSTRSPLNGAYETFLTHNLGRSLLKQLPAGSYVNPASGQSSLRANRGLDDRFEWVERGPSHAGILTTMAFQQFTNGYRAKANRIYEAFLCRRFVIPPGVIETNPDSDDLLVRQPCASCHIHLEPMGDFFRKWEVEGTNYAFTNSRNDKGKILVDGEWKEGQGAPGFGAIMASDPRFADCAVQTSFEFLMGRSPTPYERTAVIPKALENFATKHDFADAMSTIIRHSGFLKR